MRVNWVGPLAMTKVGILTPQAPFRRGNWNNDFYPLIKWQNQIKDHGLGINFHSSYDEHTVDEQVVLIDYRFFSGKTHGVGFLDNSYIIKIIEKLKNNGQRVVLFDTNDPTGSRCFGVTQYVDVHLKKQLLKNRDEYTIDRGDRSVMCWIPSQHTPSHIPYEACRKEDLCKLRLGWNIGLVDYRSFPFHRFYPFGTLNLLNNLYKIPPLAKPGKERCLLTSYRGTSRQDSRYSFQRVSVQDVLTKLVRTYPVACGGRVSKKEYMKELRQSQAIISPFGWGEICYRDFEAFLCGAVLIKPSMSHLETFPDYFVENETYVSVDWGIRDLESVLEKVWSNFDYYLHVAIAGQERFKQSVLDSESFIQHFKNNVLQ
jgi:hypothetical protein